MMLSQPSLAIGESITILINTLVRAFSADDSAPPPPSYASVPSVCSDAGTADEVENASYHSVALELTFVTQDPQAITVSIPAGSVHSGGNGVGAETPVCVLLWSFPSLEVSMHYQKDGEQDPWSILTINSSFESCTITMGFVEFLFSVLNDLELNRGSGTQKHNSETPVETRHASSSLYPDDTLVIQDNPRSPSAIP